MKMLSKTCLALILPLSLVWACGSSSEVGNDSNAGASSTGASASGGSLNLGGDGAVLGGDGAGATSATGGTLTGGGGTLTGTGGIVATGTTACSDGKDNDGDDLIDGFDPECTGPADNDEGNKLVKINPLVDWSHDDVWAYIRQHNVPYNALHDRGYPSIGCEPCTRAIQPGEHERAGRWWWEHPETKECGLHIK